MQVDLLEKNGLKFPVVTDFLCDKVPVTAIVLMDGEVPFQLNLTNSVRVL
jgi:hypothetical protein